jgi:hypothetical protein
VATGEAKEQRFLVAEESGFPAAAGGRAVAGSEPAARGFLSAGFKRVVEDLTGL